MAGGSGVRQLPTISEFGLPAGGDGSFVGELHPLVGGEEEGVDACEEGGVEFDHGLTERQEPVVWEFCPLEDTGKFLKAPGVYFAVPKEDGADNPDPSENPEQTETAEERLDEDILAW